MEKLVRKITYYMINQNHLHPISKSILKLIQLNQQFVRRFQKVKNSSMLFIIQIIDKLIQENSILQKKIYQILLNRGYVMSLDEFYQLNGYDAQHNQSYNAKKDHQSLSSQSDTEEYQFNSLEQNNKQKKSSKQIFRKKKGIRIDCRYSWKQKVQVQQIENDKSKYPINKTNYQIRQSFQKFIGDFLQNQNLNEMFIKYKFEDGQNENGEHEEKIKKKQGKMTVSSSQTIIHKRIFEGKIQSVLTQLKANNIKVSSKILQIIDSTSNQAINNKINNFGQKKQTQRKNSQRRQSGNLLAAQRKLRQSSIINDRKIINQNFFRQLMRRNTTMQNYINQQIMVDTDMLKNQLQTFQNQKVNSNVIEFKKRQNTIIPYSSKSKNIKTVSNFAQVYQAKQGKAVFLFNKKDIHKTQITQENQKDKNKTSRFFQTQLNCKYPLPINKQNISSSQLKNQSVTQKIRMARQQWQFRNQRSILQVIQNATMDPSNPYKFVQTLQSLNRERNLKLSSSVLKNVQKLSCSRRDIPMKYIKRFNTQMCQLEDLVGDDQTQERRKGKKQIQLTNLCYDAMVQQNRFNDYSRNLKDISAKKLSKRIRTQQNSSRYNVIGNNMNSSTKDRIYQVYDRRLRKFIR